MKELARTYLKGLVLGSGVATAIVLAFVIAYAADILTIDKDGAIRFRVSETGKVTLNTTETAQGDLRFTTRAGDPTAPLEGDLWYNATVKTAKLSDGTTSLPVPGKFQKYTTIKTDGSFTTTSTSFVDVPGLSVAFTTDYSNQTILINCNGKVTSNNAGGAVRMDLTLDGVSLSGAGSPTGFSAHTSDVANSTGTLSFSIYYTVPSAGNHTVQVQMNSNNAAYQALLNGNPWHEPRVEVIKFF